MRATEFSQFFFIFFLSWAIIFFYPLASSMLMFRDVLEYTFWDSGQNTSDNERKQENMALH